jgi:putative copper resistance protein D
LVSTRYGVVLVAKAICFAVVGGTALHVRRKILPRVALGRPTSMAIWCGMEVLILGVAFGVAVVLTRSSVTPF